MCLKILVSPALAEMPHSSDAKLNVVRTRQTMKKTFLVRPCRSITNWSNNQTPSRSAMLGPCCSLYSPDRRGSDPRGAGSTPHSCSKHATN